MAAPFNYFELLLFVVAVDVVVASALVLSLAASPSCAARSPHIRHGAPRTSRARASPSCSKPWTRCLRPTTGSPRARLNRLRRGEGGGIPGPIAVQLRSKASGKSPKGDPRSQPKAPQSQQVGAAFSGPDLIISRFRDCPWTESLRWQSGSHLGGSIPSFAGESHFCTLTEVSEDVHRTQWIRAF